LKAAPQDRIGRQPAFKETKNYLHEDIDTPDIRGARLRIACLCLREDRRGRLEL
jgi:hypothetical protein